MSGHYDVSPKLFSNGELTPLMTHGRQRANSPDDTRSTAIFLCLCGLWLFYGAVNGKGYERKLMSSNQGTDLRKP